MVEGSENIVLLQYAKKINQLSNLQYYETNSLNAFLKLA